MGLQNFTTYNDLLTGGVYAISGYVSGSWAEVQNIRPTTETVGTQYFRNTHFTYDLYLNSNFYRNQEAVVRENYSTGDLSTPTGYTLITKSKLFDDFDLGTGSVIVTNTVAVSGSVSTTVPTGTTAVSGTVSVGNTVGVSGSLTSISQIVNPISVSGTTAVSGTVTATPTGTQDVNVLSSTITIPVSGTVTSIPTGTTAVSGTLTSVGQITNPVAVSGTTAVSGTVSVGNTVAVSGTVTATAAGTQDVNILASAITLPVSGNNVNGTVGISGSSITLPVSGNNVNGSVGITGSSITLPVSGSVTAIPTGTQDVNLLTSTITVPVSGTVTTIPTGTQAISGTLTSVGQITNPVAVSGTTAVSGTVTAIPTGTYNVEITGSAAMLNGRLKVGLPDSEISTTGSLITKFCSIKASAAARTEITSGTAVANANMPAQRITYTVPAGKTFYLKQVWAEFDQTVTLSRLVTFDIASGAEASTIFHLISIARDSAGGLIANSHTFEKPIPIPAGTAIRIFVRTSGANSAVWLKYLGVEV